MPQSWAASLLMWLDCVEMQYLLLLQDSRAMSHHARKLFAVWHAQAVIRTLGASKESECAR